MSTMTKDERFDLLELIARENLGIDALEPTGKPTWDFRIVSVENLSRALESAYNAGMVSGYRPAEP
ncbi:hypothetical protein AWB68_05847 [Caballeronia choica]|jgi:hypothetical protein|uniref:DUF6900 domain-containing protein n=1 Tax=Caballeronia choica TaxID=326476 RepID=A0A158KH61_9BURK|nr:hypothetical protein [Caballeronia choica]SAL80394.1 hypothetical protein AWB68_05847 [Caballeronia choica]